MSNTKSKKLTYLLGLITIILLVCANTHDSIEKFINYAPIDNYTVSPIDGIHVDDKYDINKQLIPTNDGLKLNIYKKNVNDYKLLPTVKITNPIGEDIPLTQDLLNNHLPTLDGTPNTPKKMFMFAHNKSSLTCCPSTFSDDRGCICTTQEQRNFITGRGGNKSHSTKYDF